MATMLALEQHTRVIPARVSRVDGARVLLELADDLVWAMVALAYPYEPVPGDTVLAIGQDEDWYVIGVLKGSGHTSMIVPGNLSIRAPFGAIELSAARSVRIRSATVQVVAGRLDLFARSVFERFTDATRWVKESFEVRSGRFKARVDGTYDLKADRIVERAEGDVKIDGKQIKLG